MNRIQAPPAKFGDATDPLGGAITVNRADPGDVRVVLSVTEKLDSGATAYHPGIVGLDPGEARRFAHAILRAADVIEAVESA